MTNWSRLPVTKTPDPNNGTKYGGVGGLIQPLPHDAADVADEILLMMYRTNPGDLMGESGNEVPFTQRIV